MRKLLAPLLLLALPAFAGSFSSSTISWENDNFGLGRKSDRFYTNGVRISAQFSDPVILNWKWVSPLRDWTWNHLGGDTEVAPVASVSVVFGQNFYTPQIITVAAPQPLDRPWAGVLYAGLVQTIGDTDLRQVHFLEIDAGILGPGAGAQRVQKFVHNDLGFSDNDPQGWPNQLKNEPILALRYQQLRRKSWLTSGDTDVLDIVPQFGVMLGSPQTYVNAGATIRLGYHITGLPAVRIPNGAAPVSVDAFEIYVFAGVEGRYVPFNATLDGGLFHDGPRANGPERFVSDLSAGISARYKRIRFTYTVADRSAEFDVPPGAIENQRFGAFTLTIEPFTSFR